MASVLDVATAANVGAPAGKSTNVAFVLPDRVHGPAVGLELRDEPTRGVLEFHSWSSREPGSGHLRLWPHQRGGPHGRFRGRGHEVLGGRNLTMFGIGNLSALMDLIRRRQSAWMPRGRYRFAKLAALSS